MSGGGGMGMTFKLQTGRQKDLDRGTAEGVFRRKWQWICREVGYLGEIHGKEKRWDSYLDKSQEGSPEIPPRCASLAWHLAYPGVGQLGHNWFILLLYNFIAFLTSGLLNKTQLLQWMFGEAQIHPQPALT